MESLVVVGASLAGLRAVETARKDGFTGRVTLIGAEKHLPYDRPPLSKAFLDRGEDELAPPRPFYRDERFFIEDLDVDLLLGSPATALDPAAKTVYIGNRGVAYDAVVLATGSGARRLPGTELLSGVHALRTLDDAEALRDALADGGPVVVVGGGFIGSEIASSARKRGFDVTIVEATPAPLARAIGADMGAAIASLHYRNGTTLLCGTGVEAIEGGGHVERVVLTDGRTLPAAIVVAGIGSVPAVEWLDGSGLTLDNGIVCDETLWTGVEGVYAAGDVARWPNPTFGSLQRMENWTAAAEQGARAVRNALDPARAQPYATVPYYWSDWYGDRIQFVGVPDADEVAWVEGAVDDDGRWVVLYRAGERLVGALTVRAPSEIMKYRGLIQRGASWVDALEFATSRHRARA
ncbi:NAD(P)/FAD-dependent oxidoreductase [Nocardioides humilatus]|uniref:NAD(P)/FAD-dependent oxidoreductase n=1 Tax=Nocardioides humilatus TaxID=2607660 RepID=UPI001CB713C1|nr:FAD-dependent oxidoreductase [Nocardioides humilatus]